MKLLSQPATPHFTESLDAIFRESGQDRNRNRLLVGMWRSLALFSADLCAFAISFACALCLASPAGSFALSWLWAGANGPAAAGDVLVFLPAIALVLIGVLAYFASQAHYQRRIPFWSELRQIVVVSFLALLCNSFIGLSWPHHDARPVLVATWLVFPAMVVLLRTLARRTLSSWGMWRLPAIIVGEGAAAHQAATALLSEPGLGYDIAATIEPPTVAGSGVPQPWKRIMRQHRAELLVLAPDERGEPGRQAIEGLVRERVPFAVMPQLNGLPVLGFEQTCFFSHDTVMFQYRNNLAKPAARLLKVAFDLAATALLLLVTFPVLLAIAVLVKLDGGPALFAHVRVGAGGKPFKCFKFRSMRTDGEAVLNQVLRTDPEARAEWADTRKLRDDPRVTWIGKHLRSTSLDELPQLLNVLRLEMSLVGPRPIVAQEVARFADDIAYYYETRPGLTGLWQVSGRSDTTYAQRVQLDTWYVKNWTLWHDLAILAKTVPAVLQRRGAH